MTEEPRSPEQTLNWVRSIRASFDRDETYRYAVFESTEQTLLGEVMLLNRNGAGERAIGYWLDTDHVGHGYAWEAAAALTRVAFELLCDTRIDLRCVTENERSAALATKLGYVHEGTLRQATTSPGGVVQDLMVWAMLAADYPSSPASGVSMRAFDCLGERLP